MIDTHCHLDIIEEEGQAIHESLEKSEKVGVEKIVQIGINYKNSLNAISIAKNTKSNTEIFYTIGCHPADKIAKEEIDEVEEITNLIRENSSESKMVGIGEIGLDYFHLNETKESQQKNFRHFLELSIEQKMPVIIHSRDSAEDTFKILEEYKDKAFGVIHCFTYDLEYAKKYSELGYYISFSGILVFKNAKDIQNAARDIPLKNILIETDSPFLAPPPNRGKRNDSSNLPFVLEKMFSLRNESNKEVEECIYKNSEKFISRKRVEE